MTVMLIIISLAWFLYNLIPTKTHYEPLDFNHKETANYINLINKVK